MTASAAVVKSGPQNLSTSTLFIPPLCKPNRGNPMLKNLVFSLLCAAITLSCGNSADAKIIYSGLLNETVYGNLGDRDFTDVLLDGTASFFLTAYEDMWIEYFGPIMAVPGTQQDEWLADGFYLKRFDQGFLIGPGGGFSSFPDYNYNMIRSLFTENEWTGSEGFFAFEYNPSGSLPLYGWGRLNLTSDNTALTFVDWAYEDSGAPILAGQIPEPTVGTMICGSFAASAFLRRRQNSAMHRNRP